MEFATSGLSMDAILKRFSNPICEQKRSPDVFQRQKFISPSDTPSKSTDIIYSIMRSEIKCKESYPKAILNSGKECIEIAGRWKIEIHLLPKAFPSLYEEVIYRNINMHAFSHRTFTSNKTICISVFLRGSSCVCTPSVIQRDTQMRWSYAIHRDAQYGIKNPECGAHYSRITNKLEPHDLLS